MDRVQSGRPLEPAARTSRRFGAPNRRGALSGATGELRTSRRMFAFVAIAAVTALMAGVASPAHATTPGENGRIVFSLDKGSGYDLYTIKHDGTDLRKLISLSGDAIAADWSPNGRRVVFAYDTTGGSNIAIMRAGRQSLPRPDAHGLPGRSRVHSRWASHRLRV